MRRRFWTLGFLAAMLVVAILIGLYVYLLARHPDVYPWQIRPKSSGSAARREMRATLNNLALLGEFPPEETWEKSFEGPLKPADPWGTAYQYRNRRGVVSLVSAGPDRDFSTGDDIVVSPDHR